jgi:hypothetical protein
MFTAGCKTDCDENDITINNSLPRPKIVCDGMYEPLVLGLNVVVSEEMTPKVFFFKPMEVPSSQSPSMKLLQPNCYCWSFSNAW